MRKYTNIIHKKKKIKFVYNFMNFMNHMNI